MPAPSRRTPVRLRLVPLEDRLTPATFDPTRVLVSMTGPSLDSQWVAVIDQSPAVVGVTRLADKLFRADLAPGATVDAALAEVARLPNVVSVQPDYQLALGAVTPNDPGVGGMWQYATTDAAAAWGVSTGTGSTIVAVIDTGVDVAHPDLQANIWHNLREIAGNGRDDDGNGFVDDVTGWNFADNTADVTDTAGHGTHAAGIVGAVGDNGQGVAGVNWHARIMPLKFMSGAAGGFTSDAVRAIDYAVANGARVILESWGGSPYDTALAAATQRARAAGVVVVAAAGNYTTDTDSTPFYPAGYAAQADNVIAVAASTRTDGLAGFSNFGRTTVAIAAPGENINSTLPGNRYGLKSGTSMAAPFVAGAVSLVWDAHPTWTYQQVLNKVKASVDPLPGLAGKVATGGRLDLGKLLDAGAVSPPPVSPPVSPPITGTARVAEAIVGGPRVGAIDRAWVRFTAAVDPSRVGGSVTLATPTGTVSPSAVQVVSGTGNTQFVVVFGRTYTADGNYTLAVNAPAVAERFTQIKTLGSTPAPPPVVPPPPVAPPVSPPPSTARQTVAAAGLPRAVLDGRTTRVELFVPTNGAVRDVAVQLSVQHARVSDLSVRLTAPDGRKFTLFNRRGGLGADLTGTLFTDAAVQSLAAMSSPFAGAVRPEQPLSALNGANGRGLWVVELFDLAAGVGGTLTGATLSFAAGSTQSVAWSPPAATEPVFAVPSPTPTAPVLKPATAETGRPDSVAMTPVTPKAAPRGADVTGWLVSRLQDRLG